MTLLSDARGTSSLFDSYDNYIEQIHQVLRANHVPFGTPFDFLILAQTLENNSQLRNDLAVLLQSFMDGEDKITHRTALGIIAVASGGPDFTTSSDGIGPQASGIGQPSGNGNQQINVLVDLLMSVGGRTLTTPQNSGSHFNRHALEPIDDQAHQAALLTPYTSDHRSDTEQFVDARNDDSTVLEAVPVPASPDSNYDAPAQDSSPRSGTEDPLAESLIRLELNALQVKHYLDSIDQRISRIEPRLDSLPTPVPPPTAPDPVSESLPGFGYGHVTDRRYSGLLATETPHHQTQDEPPPLDRPHIQTTIPSEMSSLLERSSRRRHSQKKFEIPVITGAALVLLLLLYWGFNQNTPSPRIDPENPSLSQNAPIPASNPTSANHGNHYPPSEGITARPSPSHIATAEVLPEVHHRPLRSSKSADRNAPSPSSGSTTAATSANPEKSDDSTLDVQPVYVSSGVMAGNVLSAPQPSYPLLASLTRMRGEVVMKAIISKEGTIENVHVIKGHRLLRGAATNAVRSWRYRPYLVDGRPVAVATTVSVDFSRAQ